MKKISRLTAWLLALFLLAGSLQAPVSAAMAVGDGTEQQEAVILEGDPA